MELELKRIDARASIFAQKCDLFKKFIQAITLLGVVGMLIYCVIKVAECNTDSIKALSQFVKDFRISNTILGLSNFIWLGLYYKERKGKKRAIEQKGAYQIAAEKNDANRSSSGLTATGDTP